MQILTKRKLIFDVLIRPHGAVMMGAFFLIFFAALVGMAQPFIIRDLVDVALPQGDFSYTSKLAMGLVAVAACVNAVNVLQASLFNKIGQSIASKLRAQLFNSFMHYPLEYFANSNAGALQSKIISDVSAFQSFFTLSSASIASYVALTISNVIALGMLDVRLLLISVVIVPLAAYVNITIGEKKKNLAKQKFENLEELGGCINQFLSESGISVIKTFGRDQYAEKAFERRSNELSSVELKGALAGRWQLSLINFLFACSPALTYWFAGAIEVEVSGQISIGTIVAATGLQYALFGPFIGFLKMIIEFKSSSSILERIVSSINSNYVNSNVRQRSAHTIDRSGLGFITCKNVSFSYGDRKGFIIHESSIEIKLGSKVAIVGKSGSGKSTLAHILCGLYSPTAGDVFIDGKNIRDLNDSNRSELVGIVSQDCYLFSVSILENFKIACPGVSRENIVESCKDARVHDFISSLPEGYETVVGDRGASLSGGQRQRIALARMFLKRPNIIILDESTSALDSVLEQEIFELLRVKMEDSTIIFVTHRLSSIKNADEILLMSDGKIVSQASHLKLLGESKLYQKLLKSQSSI